VDWKLVVSPPPIGASTTDDLHGEEEPLSIRVDDMNTPNPQLSAPSPQPLTSPLRQQSHSLLSTNFPFRSNFRRQPTVELGATILLRVEAIRCRDLVDTGNKLDPQDPSVKLKIAGKHFKTERYLIH